MRPVGSKYLLDEPIGRGSTGTVWRGRVREAADQAGGAPSQPGEVVAVKVLKEELAGDPDIVMRFLRERSVLLRLAHPNIVRLRDLVVEGELLALVMDLVNGPDLHRYVRESGPFSPMGAALLTAGIADALAASHAQGVVHRDLKPANVLLATSEDGSLMHPMLTDFGIARLADSPGVTRAHEFVGTPAYVAPESAEGRPQTSAVDIYGAGILLYELVTGAPPFRGESALEVLHQHLSAEPRRPSTVPEPLWTVIGRCLRKEPGERPSAQNLAHALRVVGHGIGVHATPAAVEAALGVAALLGPDLAPAPVPGAGEAALGDRFGAEPTQVLPAGRRSPYGPGDSEAAPTSVLPHSAPDPASGGGADRTMRMMPPGSDAGADRTMRMMPPGSDAGADRTRMMPPAADGGPAGAGEQGPHPWQTQLNAARRRNEQTAPQFLDPGQDPLRHRPRRRPAYPEPGQDLGPQPHRSAAQPQPRPQAQPAPRYEPEPRMYEPEPRRAEPQQRPAQREPAPRREPRPRTPMRIPGLGCFKGCLFMVLILVAIAVLVWNFTPVPQWVAQGQSWYQAVSGWIGSAWHWVSTIGQSTGQSTGRQGG